MAPTLTEEQKALFRENLRNGIQEQKRKIADYKKLRDDCQAVFDDLDAIFNRCTRYFNDLNESALERQRALNRLRGHDIETKSVKAYLEGMEPLLTGDRFTVSCERWDIAKNSVASVRSQYEDKLYLYNQTIRRETSTLQNLEDLLRQIDNGIWPEWII